MLEFTRDLYKATILPNIPDLESIDTDKYITDLSYHQESKKHPHCFWYCVDVCWRNDIEKLNSAVTLFQCLFSDIENKLQMDKQEFTDLQVKVKNSILGYLNDNVSDIDQRISEYNKRYDLDLLSSDLDDWWKTYC